MSTSAITCGMIHIPVPAPPRPQPPPTLAPIFRHRPPTIPSTRLRLSGYLTSQMPIFTTTLVACLTNGAFSVASPRTAQRQSEHALAPLTVPSINPRGIKLSNAPPSHSLTMYSVRVTTTTSGTNVRVAATTMPSHHPT